MSGFFPIREFMNSHVASWKTALVVGGERLGLVSSPGSHPCTGSPPELWAPLCLCCTEADRTPRLCTACKCYRKALVTGKNNASEVNEVMGTSVPDPSPVPWLLFVHIWASLFIFAGLQLCPRGGCSSFTLSSKEEGHLG